MQQKLSTSLEENQKYFRRILRTDKNFDIISRTTMVADRKAVYYFVDGFLKESIVEKLLEFFYSVTPEDLPEDSEELSRDAMPYVEVELLEDCEQITTQILSGVMCLFIDGYSRCFAMDCRTYPMRSVEEPDKDKVLRGPRDGFVETIVSNTALIRKRIRSTDMKVEELTAGVRSNTRLVLVYMKELVYPEVLEQIRRGIDQFVIDGVLDSGIIEQLTEEDWVSPFPQFQTTQRPDRAALAVLEGRIVLLCDNSPVALILPTDLNSFLKTSDDYYNRFGVATFARILRYMAAFFAMTLPGLYLAVTNFHTQILPTPLLLSFWEARIGVPFPAALEVILMEISFELLREAGVRLPGAMGNTIGIVGGLIIGQAAVDANLVSPIVVIVVAFTALCSFSIPNEEFAFSFRILKFYVIVLSAWLGFFGFLIALLTVFIHLSRLESFGIPYLMPFVGADVNDYHDERDSIWRAPLKKMVRRPIYAKRGERIRLRKK